MRANLFEQIHANKVFASIDEKEKDKICLRQSKRERKKKRVAIKQTHTSKSSVGKGGGNKLKQT